MHTTREQHMLTAPAATFDGSFIEADSTLKALSPKHSMQPEVHGDLQTQKKHLLPTSHAHSKQTADPLSIQECGALVLIFRLSLHLTTCRNCLHVYMLFHSKGFINRLKVIRFSDDLMPSGRLFHKLGPSYLKLLRPYAV